MWVESEEGKGSSFYFIMKYKIGSEPEEKPALYSVVQKEVKIRKILLVEDDEVNQIVLSRMLQEKDHVVDVANNGLEALKACENKKYDIILMDIQLPEMDGIEATKQIREKEGLQNHTPIIALTALAHQGDREKFLKLGMDEYIPKPVNMGELFLTIERVCERKEEEPGFNEWPRVGENGELIFIRETPSKPKEELTPIIVQVIEI